MNIDNLEYLKKNIQRFGFGDKLNTELEKSIKQQPETFSLKFTGEFRNGKDSEKMDYELRFNKSKQSDMYFFNNYTANLRHEDMTKQRSQTFYIDRNTGITAKEAFNLLHGRSVHKDLITKDEQPYTAWVKLDFMEIKNNNYSVKHFSPAYGYDLEKALGKYPLKELSSESAKADLMNSLRKGNLQLVTFATDGKEQRMFIEANVQYKNITVYDSDMNKLRQGIEKSPQAAEPASEQNVEMKKDNSKKVDAAEETEKKSSRRRGMNV